MENNYLQTAGSFECLVELPEAGWIGEAGVNESPFIRIPVRVNGGPETGKLAIWRGWLTEKAFDNTIRRLKEVFNFDGDLGALALGKASLAGLPCNIETGLEDYEGKKKCVVNWLNVPGGGGGTAKPLEKAKLDSLLARLSARGKAVAKSTTGPAPAAPRTTQAELAPAATGPADDEDVPFN